MKGMNCKIGKEREAGGKKRKLFNDNKGMTTVEIILIVVVLVGLVLIFKTQIQQLAETVFQKIAADSSAILA